MSKDIKVALVQLVAEPAPVAERLARAKALVVQAAQAGAQLVLLPELFSTGYAYRNENFALAEPADGPTAQWMKSICTRLGIHLAGSFFLREGDEIYNALLLYAPDGRFWRYDKYYPWGWERAYFRERRAISVAETDLGSIGMLLCWDMAHADLWRQYAGKVDLMLACSCPPNIPDGTFSFPDGTRLTNAQMGPMMARMRDSAERVFVDVPAQQTAWLGVPFVGTTACGMVHTSLPNPFGSILGFLPTAPWLLRYLPQYNQVKVSARLVEAANAFAADGSRLAGLRSEQGETFTLVEISLADERPQPRGPQPKPPVPFLVYLTSDMLLTTASLGTYARRNKDR